MAATPVNPFITVRTTLATQAIEEARLADEQLKRVSAAVASWILSDINKTGTLELWSTNLSNYGGPSGYADCSRMLDGLQRLIVEAGFGCVKSSDGEGAEILTITRHP